MKEHEAAYKAATEDVERFEKLLQKEEWRPDLTL